MSEKPYRKVYIEITDVCNLCCSFCPGTKRKKKYMSPDEFDRITDEVLPFTDFIYLHLMGEPLLHPRLNEILLLAKNKGLKVIVTTNGTLLDKCGDMLIGSGALFKVNISLQSFEGNNSADSVSLQKYLDCVFDFAEKSSSRNIITVMRLWNEGELGRNALNDRILLRMKERFPGPCDNDYRGFRLRPMLFAEYGEAFEWTMSGETENENITCFALKDQFGILCDGTVVPCCIDCDGNLALGNVFEKPLNEILSSHETADFREKLDRHIPPSDVCLHCGFAKSLFGK